ncbi:hypothetical protein KF840_16650 [bacterium]|nr:hypothetical protein [bacterium]
MRSWQVMAMLALLAATPALGGEREVDVNRPRSPFDCDLPIGIDWYGSTARCLDELCGNFNVINEWLFVDDHKRRRRNPCYGRNPTSFDGQ